MANSENDQSKEASPAEERSALRQGSVLPDYICRTLHLIHDDSVDAVLIVASHDCDCVRSLSTEPYIELMQGAIIASANGNFTNAKNSRALHLELIRNAEPIVVEIAAAPKLSISKSDLRGVSPDSSYEMSNRSKRTFSIWLRSRYSRTALPDELAKRLGVVKISIEDVGKASPYAIHQIYIYYEPRGETAPTDIYEVQIFVVYDTEVEGAKSVAEAAAIKIQRRFELKYKAVETESLGVLWKDVFLSSCEAIPDTDFTFADMLSFEAYQLDHISLRQDPQGFIPEAA